MALQFGRSCRLTLGTTELACAAGADVGLRIQFKVTKNLKPEPNKVEIKVWNLAPDTRKSIEQPKIVPVKLEVGYKDDLHTIYLGELYSAHSEKQETDIITSISSGDKEAQITAGRALVQVPAKASPSQLLSLVAQGMGIALGNVATAPTSATTGGPARTYHGVASDILGQVCRSNGLEWSVQDGALQILPIGKPLRETAVRLSQDSGMIGSPTVDNKGILSITALIQPDLLPGLPIVVEAELLQGAYRIEEVDFIGDTYDKPWYAQMKCRKWA